jgi:hypothetical protein
MKQLITSGVFLLLAALCVVTASPLPLVAPGLLASPQAFVMLGVSAVDVAAITSYAANNQKQLISTLINGLDIANDIMVQPNVKNKIPMPKLKVGNGLRPYNGAEQFKINDLKYTDRFLEVQVGKRELRIDPEDYRSTYLAWSTSPGASASKKEIPFAEFMWDQVIKAVQREINDETAYKGFDKSTAVAFVGGDTYAPGDVVLFATATNNPNGLLDYYLCIEATTAGQSPTTHPAKWREVNARAVVPGLEHHILAAITASEIAPVATGAITSSAGVAITAFNKLFRAFSAPYKSHGIVISASYTDYEFLLDDLLNAYNKYTMADLTNGGMPYIVLPNSGGKCVVKPATWLGSSRRLIAGPYMPGDPGRHMNLYMGTELLSDANSISIKDTELWTLKAGIKAALGFQIQDVEAIKVGSEA